MTPAERQLVEELFDRLATLEDAARDPEAERLIRDGLRQAPNAIYALVQTALVQDETLRHANARIQELEASLGVSNEPQRKGGFLDNMRGTLFGRRDEQPRGSVPTVKPGENPMGAPPGYGSGPMGTPPGFGGPGGPPGYGTPMHQGAPMQQPGRGGSFLGTAAAAAAGVIGGSLLLDGIRGMMGGRPGGQAMADPLGGGQGTPWGNTGGGGDLARQAGLDDIGRGGGAGSGPFGQNQGLFGGGDPPADDPHALDGNFDGGDAGGFDGGGFDGGGGGGD